MSNQQAQKTKAPNVTLSVGQVTEIAHTALMPDPDQPRKSFDEKGIAALAESISKRGVLVPLQVRSGLKGKYVIHDGERRYRAARLAKLKTVPVLLIDNGNEEDLRTTQLAVNNLREKLKPMEVARLLADLQRKHFATTNDIAAHLDRNGMPAMTPKDIQLAIQLCDLPDAVQTLIDAGQVEHAAAAQLHCVLQYPKVLKSVEKQLQDDVKWRGRLTAREVEHAIERGLGQHGVDLGHTQSYYQNPVHFNPKTVCKRCDHLVSIGGNKYCMNVPEFERKNAEAKAAGLLPGGKIPPKAPPKQDAGADPEVEQKAEKRTETLQEKCRDYLHAYLASRIIRKMSTELDITDELLTWHGMGRPGIGYNDRRPVMPGVALYVSSKEAGITGLEGLFVYSLPADMASRKLHAAIEIAHSLPWRETQVICHEMWGSRIEAVWNMDEAFLDLFRKAELLHLIEQHGLAADQEGGKAWDKLKAGELKAKILERADQVRQPQVLQSIYEQIAAPWTRGAGINWSEDDEPELCEHGIDVELEDCPECGEPVA